MSQLPKTAFTLHGGCYCSAVRYTINVPPFEERSIHTNKDGEEIRSPEINYDHCNDCRKAAGSVMPMWFIFPQAWITFSVPISKEKLPTPTGRAEGNNITLSQSENRVSIPGPRYVTHPQIAELDTFVTEYNSSPETYRTFCTRCGTNLTFVCLDGRGAWEVPELDILLGTLDKDSLEQDGIRPSRHYYLELGIGWVKDLFGAR